MEIYISYSRADDRMKRSLLTHLAALRRRGFVEIWDDNNIVAGKDWRSIIDDRLHRADIIVALISPNYLASDWCMEIEAPVAVRRAEGGEARLIPVLLKKCDWHYSVFSKFSVLPKNSKPINEWSKREKAYYEVASGVMGAVEELIREGYASPPPTLSPTTPTGRIIGAAANAGGAVTEEATAMTELDVFISHSSRDEEIAKRLITLIRSALNLPSQSIRCTSVDGYRLPTGISTDEMLRQEIYHSKTFIGLLTPNSVASVYVLFELGARWGAQKPLLPLLARGADNTYLKGPLSAINALSCDNPAQLHQFVEDLAGLLGKQTDRPAAYEKFIAEVIEESGRR